ncbi:DNA glycosylase [Daedaleopsis nitida]|nr:DNA glycosylase [Daedaleopsis nitida]
MKRSAINNIHTLARQSPHNSRVTIYDPVELSQAIESTTAGVARRSKRLMVPSEDDTVTSEDERMAKKRAKTVAKSEEPANKSTSQFVSGASRSKRVTSPRKPKPIPTALETPHSAPLQWRETYDTIKRMRESIVAPVDTMGCDRAQLKEADPKRFSTLVSLMLSSQTKDEVTDAAVAKLRDAVGGTLSIDAVINADESAIADAISKVGFWRRKTQYIKQAAQKLHDDFGSDVPRTVDELCSLPGVGPKMAFLTLQVAWKLNAGIGVDVHVHRITNRLGWHKPPTKTPEQTRLNLQSWLPRELHPEINHLLVGFGQTICAPVGPKCDQCELSSGLCPSARTVVRGKSGSKKTAIMTMARDSEAGPQIEVKFEEEDRTVEQQTTLLSPLTTLEEADHVKRESAP